MRNYLMALLVFSSAPVLAEIDLQSLDIEALCGEAKSKKLTYSRDERSAEVVCNVKAHPKLLDYRSERKSSTLAAGQVTEALSLPLRGIYYNFEVIRDVQWKNEQFKSYSVDGKVIGYRGSVTAENSKGLKAILGVYFTTDAKGQPKDIAKVYVLDRSRLAPLKVPSDLEAPLAEFDRRVMPAERQGIWALTAEVLQLPGKDVDYGTSDILLDLAKNMGGIGIYKMFFDNLKNVKEPGSFLQANQEKGQHGAFCENLLENGIPLSTDGIENEEGWHQYAAKCQTLTNNLVKAMADSTKATKWILYSAIDEEERGYVLIPSRAEGSKDTYLKVFFDISHNE